MGFQICKLSRNRLKAFLAGWRQVELVVLSFLRPAKEFIAALRLCLTGWRQQLLCRRFLGLAISGRRQRFTFSWHKVTAITAGRQNHKRRKSRNFTVFCHKRSVCSSFLICCLTCSGAVPP